MRFTDERATNLLARLFTYAPRSEERAELENYCTEALAWCLITSQDFTMTFLEAIRNCLTQAPGPALRKVAGKLQIDTQIGFRGEDLVTAAEGGADGVASFNI